MYLGAYLKGLWVLSKVLSLSEALNCLCVSLINSLNPTSIQQSYFGIILYVVWAAQCVEIWKYAEMDVHGIRLCVCTCICAYIRVYVFGCMHVHVDVCMYGSPMKDQVPYTWS